jgi:hypothetical protein
VISWFQILLSNSFNLCRYAAALKEAEEYARMQKFYNERESALQQKEERQTKARATATRQQMEMLSLQTRLKGEEKERGRVEMDAYYATVRTREAASKAEDKAKLDARRKAALFNRMELERQGWHISFTLLFCSKTVGTFLSRRYFVRQNHQCHLWGSKPRVRSTVERLPISADDTQY